MLRSCDNHWIGRLADVVMVIDWWLNWLVSSIIIIYMPWQYEVATSDIM